MKEIIMNILILTIIALVLIAAGYELCRPKDHGEYEYFKVTGTFWINSDGFVEVSYSQTDLMKVFNEDLKTTNPEAYKKRFPERVVIHPNPLQTSILDIINKREGNGPLGNRNTSNRPYYRQID